MVQITRARRMFILLAGIAALVLSIFAIFDTTDAVLHDLLAWGLFAGALGLIAVVWDYYDA